jgi:hypothetical protein
MIVVALASQTAGQASSAFGSHLKLFSTENTVPQHFASIDSGTGSTSVLGLTGNYFIGIDYRASNHTLYGAGGRLASLNLATGAATTIGLTPELVASIAFSPGDQLFAVSNSGNTLYKLDPATGGMLSSVPLTGTVHTTDGSPAPGEINGIDFGPDGTLYGIGFGLYTINPLTGVATRLTPIGSYVSATRDLFKDLDFGTDGVLRGVNNSTKASIYTIDLSTGLGIVEANSGYQAVGIASVPEPSSLVLAAIGLSGTAAAIVRRRNATA